MNDTPKDLQFLHFNSVQEIKEQVRGVKVNIRDKVSKKFIFFKNINFEIKVSPLNGDIKKVTRDPFHKF